MSSRIKTKLTHFAVYNWYKLHEQYATYLVLAEELKASKREASHYVKDLCRSEILVQLKNDDGLDTFRINEKMPASVALVLVCLRPYNKIMSLDEMVDVTGQTREYLKSCVDETIRKDLVDFKYRVKDPRTKTVEKVFLPTYTETWEPESE